MASRKKKRTPVKRKPVSGFHSTDMACFKALAVLACIAPLVLSMEQPPATGQRLVTAKEYRARHAEAAPVILYRHGVSLEEAERNFRRAMAVVERNEGGFVPVDGASGAPAIYGINAKWHPEAYAEAKRLTEQSGERAGKAYAREFYKREFWDRYGTYSLPPETQVVVFDAVVNHATAFSKRLLNEARAGATAGDLLVLRWQEYHRLADARPDMYAPSLPGWMSRLENTAKAALQS